MENDGLKLYDLIAQQKEVLEPNFPGKISMYVCGVTTYYFSHLCHACAVNSSVNYKHTPVPAFVTAFYEYDVNFCYLGHCLI